MTMMATTSLGFTSHLRETLVLSRCKLDEWVEHEKERIDVLAESYRAEQKNHQNRIDRAVASLVALQLEGGLSIADKNISVSHRDLTKEKEELLQEQERIKDEIEWLRRDLETKHSQVQELRLEVIHERDQVQRARDWKDRVESSKDDAVAHLERGIAKYKAVGLEFDKGDEEGILRFAFTQLDPSDPDRVFAFSIYCGDGDDSTYELRQCDYLGKDILDSHVKELNDTDDMSLFVRRMRKSFQAVINGTD